MINTKHSESTNLWQAHGPHKMEMLGIISVACPAYNVPKIFFHNVTDREKDKKRFGQTNDGDYVILAVGAGSYLFTCIGI